MEFTKSWTTPTMSDQLTLPGFDMPSATKTSVPGTQRLRESAIVDADHPLGLFFALFPSADSAAHMAERADALRLQHRLSGRCIRADRLHITLNSLGVWPGRVPQLIIDSAMAAASTTVHAPVEVALDRALTFIGSGAFVMCGHDNSAVKRLGATIGISLKRFGVRHHPSRVPHMTLLYDRTRAVSEHPLEPIRWTVTEFVLVLSHLGMTDHEWLGRWPLTAHGRQAATRL